MRKIELFKGKMKEAIKVWSTNKSDKEIKEYLIDRINSDLENKGKGDYYALVHNSESEMVVFTVNPIERFKKYF